MLFDPKPKKRREDLFGREKELNELLSLNTPITLVYGIRRIGKTSLLNVFCNETKKCVFVDARGVTSYDDLIDEMFDSTNVFDEIKVKMPMLEISKKSKKINKLKSALKALDDNKAILVIDEAQELRYLRGIRQVLAWSYDNLENLKIIMSGSEIGVLEDFVSVESYDSPLFGRMIKEIKLDRFDEKKSLEFLERGFSEYGMKVPLEEMREAYKILGGIVGWLTYYGYYRAELGLSHSEALMKVAIDAKGLIVKELNNFLAMRRSAKKRYCCILKAIVSGLSRWSDIKRYCNESNDKRLTDALKRLEKYSFIEKDKGYKLSDPLMKEAIGEVCS